MSNKYISKSPQWDQEIIEAYARGKYNKEQSRQDQNEVLPQSQENSTPVNQDQQPIPNRQDGKFIELGIIKDIALIDKATNLVNGRENISCFYSYAPTTIEQAKEDFPELSLCLLFSTENEIFRIVEIMSHCPNEENTEGCFVTYRVNVTYKLSNDIREILEKKEEYEKIKIAQEQYEEYRERNQYPELEYATLNMLENAVKEYQEMLKDPNYKKGLEKGEENMQKMQSKIDRILELEIDPLMKEQIRKILQSI